MEINELVIQLRKIKYLFVYLLDINQNYLDIFEGHNSERYLRYTHTYYTPIVSI